MKRLIIIILIMLFMPVSYVGAEDNATIDPAAKGKTLMFLKDYLPLADKYNTADCLDCIEDQRQIIDAGRMGAGGEITNPLNESESKKNNTLPFSLIIMPNIKESQPPWIIQFTYSF